MPKRNKISVSDIKNSKYFIPNEEINKFTKTELNLSWFDLETTLYTLTDKINIENKVIDEVKIITSKNIKLSFNKIQKQILLKWFESARLAYNATIYYFKHNKLCSFFTARREVKKIFPKYINLFNEKYYVPCLIIDNAINDVCKAYKSTIALLKNGEITHFKLKYKKYTKDKQSIVLEKTTFNDTINCFYPTNFKKNIVDFKFKKVKNIINSFSNKSKEYYEKFWNSVIEKSKKHIDINLKSSSSILKENIKCDSRLSYNRLNNTFILHTPKEQIIKSIKKKDNVCAIDPGNKTFLTIYDPEGKTIKICNRDTKSKNLKFDLMKNVFKRKEIHKYINSKFTNSLINDNKDEYIKSKSKIKKYYSRLTLRIQNIVKELHYKSANFLCKNYSTIILGKLNVQGITSKEGNLKYNDKLFSYAISHDKFRTILKQKALKYGSKVHIVCEGNTSRTCGVCGCVKEIKYDRVYNCKVCKSVIDRDINGARNILIKHQNLIC
jgi:IS605 OrfB family transposase